MSHIHTGKFIAAGTAAVACLAVSATILAQSPSVQLPNVTYSASGTFASPQISGNDLFKLAGEPFNIEVIANEGTAPTKHGRAWAAYTGLRMKGHVTSALVPQSPFTIESAHTFLALALGNPSYEVFEMTAPVIVVKQKIMVTTQLQLPPGTYGKGWLNYPFTAPVSLSPSSGTVTYSDGSNTTTLAIASGTLNCQKGAPSGGGAGTR